MQSWVSDKLIVKSSKKHGMGIFSRIPIETNELIIVFGGYIDQKPASDGYFLEIIPGFYLNNSLHDPKEDPSNFLNHSCEPNAEIHDKICVYTIQSINAGDEITIDYFKDLDIAKHPEFRCHCGSPACKFKNN
jgi:uncharacterized protein